MLETMNSDASIEIIQNDLASLIGMVNPGCDLESVDSSTRLLNEGILDSLQIVSLIGEIEAHFQCRIPLDDVTPDNLGTIESIAKMISLNLANVV